MKQKSLRRRGLTFLKVHALFFALFEMGMALNIIITVAHPLNTNVLFDAFKMMVMQSLVISLIWAAVFITHLGIHQFQAARKDRKQAEHLETVERIQERYEAGARLDLDAQEDDGELVDEALWHAEHQNGQRLKTK